MSTVKARPIARQELQKLLVTDADAFTALSYLRHRESVPALPETEDKGREVLPGIEGALADLYYTLWDPEPGVREEVTPDRKYWKELLTQTLQTSAYEELHAATGLKELESVLGTIAMGESVIAMVPKEDRQKLQELAEQQRQADAADEQAQQAQAQAQAAGELAEAAKETANQAAPQQKAQAEATRQALAKAAGEAEVRAESARMTYEQAKARAEELARNLMGEPGSEEAQRKSDELRRMGMAAVKQAQAKVEEVSSTIEAWGLEEGELHRESIPEVLGLLERMKRNANLKRFARFAALLGRIRKIAARKARAKVSGEGVRIAVPETGRDIRKAERSELVALTHPALRVKALRRWTSGELRLRGERAKQKLGHGPVIVCEDGSGSMEGAKQQWAKAVTLSLAHYAKLQRRSFGWVLFDYGVRRSEVYPQGRLTPEQMLVLAESRAGGGTNFESPLKKAVEMIRHEGLKKADICFITDGECAVSEPFLREFRAAKKALEFNVVTVLCDVGSSADKTVSEFSDRIEKASAFTAEEAEGKIFSHF